jgi:hypothetical protein
MITTISTLPQSPNRNDPATFSDKADALLGAMPTLVTELNSFVNEVNTLSFKTACKAATLAAITLSGTQTIDGQNIVAGDRVLVKNQASLAENGIYTASINAWTRAPDMDTVAEVAGSFVPVTFGAQQGGKIYYTTFNATGATLGTTAIPWNSLTEASITGIGTVAVANGGTGIASYAIGDLIYASGTTTLVKLAAAASGNVLKSGTAPSWGKVALTSDVSGTLPVASGGTGAATLTANNVLLGNGTSAVQTVAPGTAGNLLTSVGGTWASAPPPAGGVTSLNSQTGAVVTTGFGDIGSVAVLMIATNTNVAVGSTVAGSDLRYGWNPNFGAMTYGGLTDFATNRGNSSATYNGGGTAPAGGVGTWRKISSGNTYFSSGGSYAGVNLVSACCGSFLQVQVFSASYVWAAALYVRVS